MDLKKWGHVRANLAYLMGVTTVYLLTKIWTIEGSRSRYTYFESLLFYSVGAVGALVNYLILLVVSPFLGLGSAKITSLIFVFFLNNSMRLHVFRLAQAHNRGTIH